MIVLGIETSTIQSSVCLGSEQEVLASCYVARGANADQFLITAINFLLERTSLTYDNVYGVAVGLGPGLFTGMRIGVSTAKTIAQALSVPIVGVPSLDVLAFDLRYSRRIICPVIDAKRHEVFFGFYRHVPGGIARISEYQVGSLRTLRAEIEGRGGDALVVGHGALLYRTDLQDLGKVDFGSMANAFPRAASLVELALPRFMREDYDSLFEVEPMYMRRSDAEIKWEKGGAA